MTTEQSKAFKDRKTNLVVPVDFKVYCLKAIDYAKKFQQKIDVKIHLIHVLETQSWWGNLFNAGALKESAAEQLEAIKKDQNLREDTIIRVIQGKSHKEIINYANEINARYIILSDNYPLTTANKKIGSTLSQTIIKAEQPVISITNSEERIFNNIAVPIDLNQSSRLQLYKSVALALNHNAKIHLISVVFNKRSLNSKRLNQKIEKYEKTYEENGIDYSTKLLSKAKNFAYKEIIAYCEKQNIDSILLMTHNEAASFDNYLGAFAQHIINKATMPVITINNASARDWEQKLDNAIVDPFGILRK